MARSALLALLCLLVPQLSTGRRASPSNLHLVEAHRGVPRLEVLRTSSAEEAGAFLEQWSAKEYFGLFVQLAPSSLGLPGPRVALLGISQGTKVLIYDLRPFLFQPPQPLPTALAAFLSDQKKVFFGVGVMRPVAQLVKEFGIKMRCLDPKVHGWPEFPVDGGVFNAAHRLLGISFGQRPATRQLSGQAVYAYLQWALVDRSVASWGDHLLMWELLDSELSEAAKHMHFHDAMRPKHEVGDDGALLRQEAAAKRLLGRRAMAQRRGRAKHELRALARERYGRLQARRGAPREGQ
eukprot:CAMPEP_0176226968 /NCGR_PEP_ID=MMETSP0121_2-20121125/22530_1 /TAXON_ID=160619 /ORGANISM="Kryptoperidinium foliaceum, Strain CCMP 1326" /LENGTH=293 /DNA_ID=CAMNT_0017566243 /DNA_START=67 /DNA_END=948 /DNA_ORIENTATION=+